jgi:hypothetical protein
MEERGMALGKHLLQMLKTVDILGKFSSRFVEVYQSK